MNAITADIVDNYTFLNAVFVAIGDNEDIAVCAFTEPPEDRETWPVYTVFDSGVNRLINPEGAPRTANSYFCISTVEPADRLRRTQDAWRGLYVVPLDDIGHGPGAKSTPDLVPLKPSYKLETSPGNWQYGYLLDTPLRDLATARALLKLMIKGNGDEGAAIASKLIRLPQGINNKRKYDEPFACRLTEWNPTLRYSVNQLLDAFGVSYTDLIAEAEKLKRARASKGTPMKDEIYEWLIYNNLVISEPDAEGFASVVCPWHAGHTNKDDISGRYSPIGCGGDYKHARQYKCFHGHCADRKIEDFTRSYFLDRFVFVRDQGMIHDLQYNQLHKTDAFRNMTAPYWKFGGARGDTKIPYSMAWLTAPERIDVAAPGFAPGQPIVYFDSAQTRRVNTYRHSGHAPSKDFGLAMPILQHIKYLFGDDTDQFLGFMGWTVHHPEDRIKYALLHIAPHHGTGRGFLKDLFIKLLVDSTYVRSTTLVDLMDSSFNDCMWQSLIVFFDEVHERTGKYKVADRIREFITESRLAVNIKHGYKGTTDVYANIVMFSNHMNPLVIPPEDRRIWPVVCINEPKPQAYYQTLYDQLKDPAVVRALYWFLKHHIDTVGFNPNARAPVNSWTKIVFGGDADQLVSDVSSVLMELRKRGARAIYQKQLVELLRERDADLPPAGESGAAWARFSHALNDCNVMRGQRVRTSEKGYGDNRAVMLSIAVDHRALYEDLPAFKAECERVLRDPLFKLLGDGND